MLNILELACHAGCPYIQPTAHAQQVVSSFQEELISEVTCDPSLKMGQKKSVFKFRILTFIVNLDLEGGK